MDSQGRRERQHPCTDAGGHRLEDTATRRFFRMMFPEVRAHFESPRQEEHRSTPAGMRTVTLSSDVVPPFGRQDPGLSRVPFPYLDEPPKQLNETMENSRSHYRSQLAILEYRCECVPTIRSRCGRPLREPADTRPAPDDPQSAPSDPRRSPADIPCAPGG